MAILKSVQYAIFCENYHGDCGCNGFENYDELDIAPTVYYRSLGYRKKAGKWYCPKCVANNYKPLNPNPQLDESTKFLYSESEQYMTINQVKAAFDKLGIKIHEA